MRSYVIPIAVLAALVAAGFGLILATPMGGFWMGMDSGPQQGACPMNSGMHGMAGYGMNGMNSQMMGQHMSMMQGNMAAMQQQCMAEMQSHMGGGPGHGMDEGGMMEEGH